MTRFRVMAHGRARAQSEGGPGVGSIFQQCLSTNVDVCQPLPTLGRGLTPKPLILLLIC